jgi:hypothetical protein
MFFVHILILLCIGLALRGSSQGISDYWLHPRWDETVVNGSRYDIVWTADLASAFPLYCASCDTAKVDLCVQPYSTRNWNLNLASKCVPALVVTCCLTPVTGGINIKERHQYTWTIDIPAEDVKDTNDLVLRFIPFGGSCDGDEEISSPRFSIEAAAASSPTATVASKSTTTSPSPLTTSMNTSKNTTTSAEVPTMTTTDTPAASTSPATAGLSTGAKAGIGVGVGLAAVLLLSALLLFLKVRKSREHAQDWHSQRTRPEKEVTANHTDPFQGAPQQGTSWAAPYESTALAKKPDGVSEAQTVQELDGRNLVSEVDGGRYDR